METEFRVVLDTNVIIASQNASSNSPNREILCRWIDGQFQVLYSNDILEEYYRKLIENQIPQEIIEEFFSLIFLLAEEVTIRFVHFPHHHYPEDPDDIAFVLCADNGSASHLVGYDSHLLKLNKYYPFTICQPIPFLEELRSLLQENN
ncbi:MAG: putative toxin-antitoxin system toxin component, PIN family [SAR324 cluster bacterium]|nr:putative toxin-antitoxin system toxin component, PIN family [SAR324 cluster bacterium]